MPEQVLTIESPELVPENRLSAQEHVPVEVFVKQNWNTGPWIKTDLIPQWVEWSTAESGMGRCQVIHRYGSRLRTGPLYDDGNRFEEVLPVDYHDYFIKITFTGSGLTDIDDGELVPPLDSPFARQFIGQIDTQAAAQGGGSDNASAGAQILIANSIEHVLFGKHFIMESRYREFHTVGPVDENAQDFERFFTEKTCKQGLTFNKDGLPNQWGRERGGGRVTGLQQFMTRLGRGYPDNPDPDVVRDNVPTYWSTRDIVEYALGYWLPVANNGDKRFDVRISFENLFKLPDWDKPVVDTHGHRPLEVLRRVLSRRRLYVWWIEMDEKERDANGAPVLRFRVQTTTAVDVGEPGQAIPANDDVLAIDADSDASIQIALETDKNSVYDQIIVQGAKRRNVMSLEFETPGVDIAVNKFGAEHRGEPYWPKVLQDKYGEGASKLAAYIALTDRDEKKRFNDLERARDEYQDVFQRFGMSFEPGRINYPIPPESPTAWGTGNVYSVGTVLADGNFVYEVIATSGEESTGTEPFDDPWHVYEVWYENCFGSLRLVQKLPLLATRDYSGNKIASGDTKNATLNETVPEELTMFVVFKSEAKAIPGEEAVEEKYIWASKNSQLGLNPPKEEEDRDWSSTVRVVKDDTSFHIKLSGKDTRPHSIAKSTLLPLDVDEEDEGKVDWQKMIATIAYEGDRYCESVYPPEILGIIDNLRVLRVDAGRDYKLDWVQPDTVVDIDAEGQLVRSDSGGYIRDDRLELEDIARRAHGYYGVQRGILSLTSGYKDTGSGIRLGRMISKVRNGSVDVDAGDPLAGPTYVPLWRNVNSVITSIKVVIPYQESEAPVTELPPVTIAIKTAFGELDPRFFVRNPKRRKR